ncbi:MAG: hypothetical protein HFE68_02230 [Erysipelotrichaceae bacterium]|nr:hypothetical protein [Erysipelotrichaceae bacterium]
MNKKHWIIGLAILLPIINILFYLPIGMYNVAFVGIGSVGENGLITIPRILRDIFNMRLYFCYFSGACMFLWGWCLLHTQSIQTQRIIATGTFLVCVTIRLAVRFGGSWMFEYYRAFVADFYIWQGVVFLTLLYVWLKPLVKGKKAEVK